MNPPAHAVIRRCLSVVGVALACTALASPATAVVASVATSEKGMSEQAYVFRPRAAPVADCDSVDATAWSPSLTYAVMQCERYDARPNATLLMHPQGGVYEASSPSPGYPVITEVTSIADDGWAAGVVMEAAPVPNGLTLMPALWSPVGELHLGRDVVAGQAVAVVNSVVMPGGALLASIEAQPSRTVATWWWAPGRPPLQISPPTGFTEVRILERGTVSRSGEATLSLTGPGGVHGLGRWSPSRGLRVAALPDGYTEFEPYAASDGGQYVVGRGDRDDGSDILVVGRNGTARPVVGVDAVNASIDDAGDLYGRGPRQPGVSAARLLKVTSTQAFNLTAALDAPAELASTVEVVRVAGNGVVAVRYARGRDDLMGVLEPTERRPTHLSR